MGPRHHKFRLHKGFIIIYRVLFKSNAQGQYLLTECSQQEVNFCPTLCLEWRTKCKVPVHHQSACNILCLFWLSNNLASLNFLSFKHIVYEIPSELAIQVVGLSTFCLCPWSPIRKREYIFFNIILERDMSNHQRILNLLINLKCTSQVAQPNEYCIRTHSFFLSMS